MNNKQKKRKERLRQKLQEANQRETSPVIDEREHFLSMDEAVEKHGKNGKVKAILYDRVSSNTQSMTANAESRKPFLQNECKNGGAKVVEYVCETASGYSHSLPEREVIFTAVVLARENKAVLVVPCIDRLVRAESGGKFDPLTEKDIQRVMEVTGSVSIVSIIPPGTPMKQCRSLLTKWGQAGKNKPGGRPRKKRPFEMKKRRQQFSPIVAKLRKRGLTYEAIRKRIWRKYKTEISRSTVRRWCLEWENTMQNGRYETGRRKK